MVEFNYSWEANDRGIWMKEQSHAWIAVRAIALLEDEKDDEEKTKERDLVRLLKPHAREASVGAWIPDHMDAKRGGSGSATFYHIFKMMPYSAPDEGRFITKKEELLKRIGEHRETYRFLQNDDTLDPEWWATPYRADPSPGKHLPNRAMALSTTMKDLLLMGCQRIDHLIPGEVRFAQYMVDEVRTQEEAAVMYFFMLSHFIADMSMPCHCDARKLAGHDRGLHMELERHWSNKVGKGFGKKNLLPKELNLTPAQARADSNRVLKQARAIDDKFGKPFGQISIPDLLPKHDVWLEAVNLCRASFAMASIIAPPDQYPYDDPEARAPFKTVLGDGNRRLLDDVNRTVMHDAVLNTAIVWKHVWNKVSKMPKEEP